MKSEAKWRGGRAWKNRKANYHGISRGKIRAYNTPLSIADRINEVPEGSVVTRKESSLTNIY